jgi:tRNA dimethylallyltransferase
MKPLARLVAILGPTASGKSALGIWLAERLGGEILVCDSTQVYRYFEIGTAKVTPAERHGTPHHLVDLVEPDELFTAGEYRRRALEILEDVKRRGRLPILTAGTGLYLRALLEGLADAPGRSEKLRARLRERAERRGGIYLHRLLGRLDPATATRIAPHDTQKVIRALEIRLVAGKPVGEIHHSGRKGLEGYVIHKIGLAPQREQLYVRIDRRVEAMLEAGWLEEVKTLLVRRVPATAKPFEFIGYAELREHLEGRVSREEAIKQIQQATRRYAKRQMTWFRREPGVEWFAGFGDDPGTREAVLAHLAQYIGG